MNQFATDIAWEIEQINSAVVYYEKAVKHCTDKEQANKYKKQINRLNKQIKQLENSMTWSYDNNSLD